MIGYHWSPFANYESIKLYGLLVPTKHPILTQPMVCSEGHRNPHISLGRTPSQAWDLSGGFLIQRAKEQGELDSLSVPMRWDLYEVDLGLLTYRRAQFDRVRYQLSGCDELQVRVDIAKFRVNRVGQRWALD